ncbi:hypothetical protein KP509_03G028000 [Ceratopteris richardii]|uniref:RING-type domain-containing protein n=1 Tax=Ceratopteris richardii TaxID=49495 RepID=A0A8T2V5L8_CERRI|nr:hypothetical protein KP509_03G028000 [Ceratopteris richardii]
MSLADPRGPCFPGCFCDRCIPLRMRDLEALSPSQQRAFWSRITSSDARMPADRASTSASTSAAASASASSSNLLNRLFPEQQTSEQRLPDGVSRSTQLRAMWDIPHYVVENVPDLIDSFEAIQEDLEAHAGPRRKQVMLEAMQEVLRIFTTALAPGPVTAEPVAHINVLNIRDAQLGVFDQNSTSNIVANMCSICCEDYTNGDEIVTLSCSHIYHRACVENWFRNKLQGKERNSQTRTTVQITCPNCRVPTFAELVVTYG